MLSNISFVYDHYYGRPTHLSGLTRTLTLTNPNPNPNPNQLHMRRQRGGPAALLGVRPSELLLARVPARALEGWAPQRVRDHAAGGGDAQQLVRLHVAGAHNVRPGAEIYELAVLVE